VPGLVAHNMGIYSLGTKISFSYVDTLDFRSDPQVILYSENLLRNGYWVASDNVAVDYLMTMAVGMPLGYADGFRGVKKYPEKILKDQGLPSMALAFNVREGEMLLEKYNSVYFYPTGKEYRSPIYLDDVKGTIKFEPRTLYGIPKNRQLVQHLEQKGGFFLEENDTYCFFVYIKETELRFSYVERSQDQYSLSVVKRDVVFSDRPTHCFYPEVRVTIIQNDEGLFEMTSVREDRQEVTLDLYDSDSIHSFLKQINKWPRSDSDYVRNFLKCVRLSPQFIIEEKSFVRIERGSESFKYRVFFSQNEYVVNLKEEGSVQKLLDLPSEELSLRGKQYVSSFFVNLGRDCEADLIFDDYPESQVIQLRNGQKMGLGMIHKIREYYPREDKNKILNLLYNSELSIKDLLLLRWPLVV